MFSGLIGYNGEVIGIDREEAGGVRLRVRCEGTKRERPEPKDSVAIDGVCLTVTKVDGKVLQFDVIPETLARSTLGDLKDGDVVNVEYSLRIGDRMGGHFVYGHVDATGDVLSFESEGQGARMRVSRPEPLAAMIPEKAFIAVDGVSVTVATTGDGWFEIALIPETLERTTLGRRAQGSRVNLEVDPLARYAAEALRR